VYGLANAFCRLRIDSRSEDVIAYLRSHGILALNATIEPEEAQ
jgi:hypothetical protein